MKCTFQRFKIQMVRKPSYTITNNKKNKYDLNNNIISPQRFSKTSEIKYRKKPQNQQLICRKNTQQITYPFKEQVNGMTRSQSLQQDVKNQYKDWLSLSQVNSNSLIQKQREYKIFEEKCLDILSKKNASLKKVPSKQPQIKGKKSNTQQILISNSHYPNKDKVQKKLNKTNTVQQMMHNIIQKFKSDSRAKNHHSTIEKEEISQKKRVSNNISQTTNVSPNSKCKILTKDEQSQIFKMIHSAQLRNNNYISESLNSRNSEIRNPEKQLQCKFISAKRYSEDWKQSPQISKNRIDKRFSHTQHPRVNPIICTSMALASPFVFKKNIEAFQHIKLSPAKSLSPKRKKIHLNKPHNKKRFMKFTQNNDEQYNKKIKAFLDFLFKVNYSNNIYVNLQLSTFQDTINHHKYKVYVGQGNNCLLIKSLLKRRPWIQIVDNMTEQNIQFYWTQNKLNDVHNKQMNFKSTKVRKNEDTVLSNQKKNSIKRMHDMIELNSKLFCKNSKSQIVQEYIFKDGFQIPFKNQYKPNIATNHIPENYVIGSKKNLFKSMFSYYSKILKKDPFTVIPKTYHVKSVEDLEFKRFVFENKNQPHKLWIVKPGQNTNRGNGIRLCKFSKIPSLITSKVHHSNGRLQTYIIQSYINRPFLYNGRKFDIRHFILITSVNGNLKVYWYRDGYIRTSSEAYDIEEYDNQFIHLTNDAIQQKGDTYGKYEEANKLSYSEFQRYLDYNFMNKGYNFDNVVKQMKSIIIDVVKASYLNLDKNRKQDNFELFGFDFMLDRDFKPYLIQINFNPCLVVNCNLLNRIIPPLIENSFRIGFDPLFPPRNHIPVNKRHNLNQNYLKNLRYQIIFDENTLQTEIYNNFQFEDSENEQQEYCDNGKEVGQNFVI